MKTQKMVIAVHHAQTEIGQIPSQGSHWFLPKQKLIVKFLAHKDICCEIQVDTNCGFQAIELQLKDQQNVKVCNFYRPSWTNDSYFEDFTIAMQQVDAKGKGNIWVGGDFNLPDIDWSDVKLLPGNVNVNLSNSLIDLMNDMALTQVVDHPTRKKAS